LSKTTSQRPSVCRCLIEFSFERRHMMGHRAHIDLCCDRKLALRRRLRRRSYSRGLRRCLQRIRCCLLDHRQTKGARARNQDCSCRSARSGVCPFPHLARRPRDPRLLLAPHLPTARAARVRPHRHPQAAAAERDRDRVVQRNPGSLRGQSLLEQRYQFLCIRTRKDNLNIAVLLY
jgi:hypothetical protein